MLAMNDDPKSAGAKTLLVSGGFTFFTDRLKARLDFDAAAANVKFVDRIELTAGKGLDTRPETDDEHEKLHQG